MEELIEQIKERIKTLQLEPTDVNIGKIVELNLVNMRLAKINYTRCCESDSEQLCDHIYFDNTQKPDNCIYCNYKREPK